MMENLRQNLKTSDLSNQEVKAILLLHFTFKLVYKKKTQLKNMKLFNTELHFFNTCLFSSEFLSKFSTSENRARRAIPFSRLLYSPTHSKRPFQH